MQKLLLVMLGGAIGSGARYGVGRAALAAFGPGFPWGTLAVNLAGGFAMGLLAGRLARPDGAYEGWMLLLGTGLLGGFTTFSAFSLDTVALVERGQPATAALYALVSVAGAIAALCAGLSLARIAA